MVTFPSSDLSARFAIAEKAWNTWSLVALNRIEKVARRPGGCPSVVGCTVSGGGCASGPGGVASGLGHPLFAHDPQHRLPVYTQRLN